MQNHNSSTVKLNPYSGDAAASPPAALPTQRTASAALRSVALGISALLCVATAHAQSGDSPQSVISDISAPEAQWYEVNPEAWDAAMSGDSERMFGTMDGQRFGLSFDYMSEATLWGYRMAQHTFKPSFQWIGPLFGGESYTEVFGYLPLNTTDYANQLWIYGGWRYHLTPVVDVDVGGTFVFADKRLAGPGFLAEDGWRSRGTIYLGLIGRHWLSPYTYVIYDFELDQTQLVLAIKPELPLTDLGLPFEGFSLEGLLGGGYLDAKRWLGEPNPSGWSNSYVYWEAGLKLKYSFEGTLPGVTTHIGMLYSGNNDGSGYRSYAGSGNTGPRQQLSFITGVGYSF